MKIGFCAIWKNKLSEYHATKKDENDTTFKISKCFDKANGFGIKIRSIFGPINFTWGRGYDNIMDENSKRINLFYFNFGVDI